MGFDTKRFGKRLYKTGSIHQQLLMPAQHVPDAGSHPGSSNLHRVDTALLRFPHWYEIPASQHLIPGADADRGLEGLCSLPSGLRNCREGVSIMSTSTNTTAWRSLREAEAPPTARRREGGGL